jgi:hypothetical protein
LATECKRTVVVAPGGYRCLWGRCVVWRGRWACAGMAEIAGAESTVEWVGTFEGILLLGTVTGGLLGWPNTYAGQPVRPMQDPEPGLTARRTADSSGAAEQDRRGLPEGPVPTRSPPGREHTLGSLPDDPGQVHGDGPPVLLLGVTCAFQPYANCADPRQRMVAPPRGRPSLAPPHRLSRRETAMDVHVRPLGRDEGALLDTVFTGLSPRSRYLRFHSPVHRLTESVRRSLLEVDGRDHVALVAVSQRGEALGIADSFATPCAGTRPRLPSR